MFKKLLTIVTILTSFSTASIAQNALHFDGVNDKVQTSYGGVLGTANRTFEAWVYLSSTPTSNLAITDYGANAVGSRNTFLINPNLGLSFISGGTNANIGSSTGAVATGQWNHVAFVLNSGTGYLYVNGVQVGTGSLTSVNTPSTGSNLIIGQRVSGGSIPFNGKIDEVRIWSVARTATEIISTMNAEFCTIPSTLKAYYKANQGTASGTNTGLTTLNDNSGNSNPGTLTNFSLSGSSSNWVTGATLTSGNLTGGTTSVTGCIPYTTLGNQVLTTGGTYPDTLVTTSGCDSIYTINFTPLQPSFGTFTTTECDSYISLSGVVYDSSGVYLDTTVSSIGCDSIITLNLTINYATSSSLTVSNCLSYTSPSGNIHTTSGIFVDTIPNIIGCDSLITIDLTIFNGYYITLNEMACDTYTSPSGKTFTTSGTYLDTVITGTGCDSLYTINLTLNQASAGTVTESACDEYISSNGNTYTSTGTYTEIIGNASGCDSVITLNLTITHIDSSVTVNGNTLTAVASGLTYRWLDCTDNYSPISGGNQQSYTASESGNYAVKITDGGCSDTSACVVVSVISGVGKNDFSAMTGLEIYPNPASSNIFINNSGENTTVTILSFSGVEVASIQVKNGTQQYDISGLSAGMYLIKYTSNNNSFTKKLVVE